MKAMVAGAVFGVVANLILIPVYGGPGAAVAKVLAHAVILFSMYRTTWKELVPVPLLKGLLRSMVLAVPMVIAMGVTPGVWPVKLGLGLAIYVVTVAIGERSLLAGLVLSRRIQFSEERD
jgi:peptidoglycan biosynthesis protein MviN/MurJ (putative lipid II flippase)